MTNSLNPVFGQWYIDKQIGIGTDGKVFRIYKENYDGSRDYSILKIIRIGDNRNETQSLIAEDNIIIPESEDKYYTKIIGDISDNVKTLMDSDKGKYFVKYEDIELRKASDGKGRLILLKLEEMRSLTDLFKEFSFTLEEAIRLGISVCKSLIKCRSFGYIYPNLKPENILFDKNGVCKLGDFGTFSTLEPAKTSVAYLRTQHYMAPEFMRTGNVNCTIDTYSLGLVLFMLTNRNRLPFTAEFPESVTINSLNDAMKTRVDGKDLPKPLLASEALYKIIKKACAVNPNERYLTPKQMLSDLTSALHDTPFEQIKYDEIYSVSASATQDDFSLEISEPEEEQANVPTEEITQVVSLKEEIKIPEISTGFNFYKKKSTQRKTQTKYVKLPEIKKQVRRNENQNKKIAILIALTLLFFVVFIISLSLQNNVSDEVSNAVSACINNLLYSQCFGGVALNGC